MQVSRPSASYGGWPGQRISDAPRYGADRLRRCRRAELEESLVRRVVRIHARSQLKFDPIPRYCGLGIHLTSCLAAQAAVWPDYGLRPDQLRLATANSSLLREIRAQSGDEFRRRFPFHRRCKSCIRYALRRLRGSHYRRGGRRGAGRRLFYTTGGAQCGGRNQRSSKPENGRHGVLLLARRVEQRR